MTSLTPTVPAPWYSKADLLAEFARSSSAAGDLGHALSSSTTLPDGRTRGWLGLVWMLVAMVPTSIGGAVLAPSINSLITKFSAAGNVGGILGVSSALVSLANAITPIFGGALFQLLGSSAPFLLGGLMMGLLLIMALRHVAPPPELSQASAATS